MALRKVELTLISAENLSNVNLFTRLRVYAYVSTTDDPRSMRRTPPDRCGGRNPVWNSTLSFAVPAAGPGTLRVLLRTERALGDRDVGEVTIHIGELLGSGPTGLYSYDVRKPHSGKTKGVLRFSYKLEGCNEAEGKTARPVWPHAAHPALQRSGYYGSKRGGGGSSSSSGKFGLGLLGGALGGVLMGDLFFEEV